MKKFKEADVDVAIAAAHSFVSMGFINDKQLDAIDNKILIQNVLSKLEEHIKATEAFMKSLNGL